VTSENPSVFLFDDVRVEPATFRVFKAGNAVQVEPKVLKLLLYLIDNRGRLIEREEILGEIWNGTHVTENSLSREIAKLRRSLGDDSKTPRYIETVRTRGFRFIAEVLVETVSARAAGNGSEADLPPPVIAVEPEVAADRPPPQLVSWGRRLAAAGLVIMLAIALLVASKIYRSSGSNATGPPVAIRQITSWPGLDCNPAFSPNGQSIAYSSDHTGTFEIFAKSLAPGGREVQLTNDSQQNFDPAWSPDGAYIAYYSMKRHGIFVMPSLGGVPKQLTEFGSHPVWSPDGQWLAFQSVSSPDLGAIPVGRSTIWVVSSHGGAAKQVTQTGSPFGSHFAPSWSPDGKRIALLNFDTVSPQVWSVALDGTQVQAITDRKSGDKSWPTYSPDGKSIYYNRGEALWKTPVSSENGAVVGEPVKVADLGSTVIRNASLSSSGTRIAYSAASAVDNLVSVPVSPVTREPNGPVSFLTNEPGTRHVAPEFSPDGRKIVFTAQRRGSDWNVWMMDAEGGNLTQLTIDGGRFASWYPDGKQIAFLSVRQGHRKIWSMASAGGNETSLFELDDIENPRLSPDGKQVAFNFTRAGVINVATVGMTGGEPKQMTHDQELAGWPSWSPDARFLALEIKRGDDTHIAIIPSTGGEIIQLTFERGQSWPNGWSPDGDKIVFAGARDGIWNLWWVSRSDKRTKQLTQNTKLNVYFRYPIWSPLGNRIVSEYSESKGNIYVMEIR
jgi:Tol biopolymer transport system component/DNA-binding winged helix-turn-helix (wHTH) protein